ncbi:hypothetical protein KOR42_00870 [Thalassoglobus neptunius]|uniref:O-Antigen ligase n=1 Tax=Thalassoglobus neptunius TaxID=1938619 RepID=A0A5C5X3G0_9PLAN|nr:hypothetical protein [Thalassoglobus neptunius]TWT56733.1 hypothetical protein KOR42_00870 [Thalassoglobus neptunius]
MLWNILAYEPAGYWKVAENQWYSNQTVVHPVGLGLLITACLGILILPRRGALASALLLPCFVSDAQRVLIFGLDFSFTRILIITLLLRVLMRGDYRTFRMQRLDKLVIAWTILKILIFTIQNGSPSAFVTMSGQGVDHAGAYFAFRFAIKDWADVRSIGAAFAIAAVVVSCFFLNEWSTRRNLFSVFGGVPEFTKVRQGRLRCQGAFAHPIVAGCFWAALLPWFYGMMILDKRYRILAILGAGASCVIIVTCSSSTPVFGALTATIGIGFWYIRGVTYPAVCAFFALLAALHVSMKQPVWHLIARVSAVGGSTGYHRFNLINQAVNRFFEWAFVGTRSTAHWGLQLFDVTNQFILEGVRGGFMTMVLFTWMLVEGFRLVGRITPLYRNDPKKQKMAWCLGVCLLVHLANFFGISYFGQSTTLYFLTLATIPSMYTCAKKESMAQMSSQMVYVPNPDYHEPLEVATAR